MNKHNLKKNNNNNSNQNNKKNNKQNPFRKYLFIVLGTISFGAGAIGTVLPVIPTTPFLLLATWFYLRSSEVLHRYLINHRVFGSYLRNYQNKSIARRDKIVTLVSVYIGITISCVIVDRWLLRILMIGIALGVTWHLNSLRVIDE